MIRLHILHTGSVRVDRAIPCHERNPLALTGFLRGKDKKLTLPVSCYLIEHPKGRLLLDTGFDTKYATERPRRFCGLLDRISAPVIRANEGVDDKLRALGLCPSDIDAVYFSHLDFDHTSGVPLVSEAKRFFAAAEELKDADRYFFRYVKSTWRGVNIEPFVFERSGIGPVGRSFDVFGDGSVLLVSTPGHSHGHCSAKITGADGRYVLLTGDCVYTKRSIEEGVLPGLMVDEELARKSVDWVCACAKDAACRLIAPNHDPQTAEQTIEL